MARSHLVYASATKSQINHAVSFQNKNAVAQHEVHENNSG